MTAVFKREFKSYFSTPVGFVIVAAFAAFSALFFSVIYINGTPAVESVISAMSTVTLFATPFITMRIMSEDRRQKVDQVLLTSPVSIFGIVVGKFFAALSLFALGFSVTLIYQLIVTVYVQVNWLIYLYALFGMLLLGSAMIAIGIFISSLTESAVISAALTFTVFLGSMLIGSYADAISSDFVAGLAKGVAFMDRFYNFTYGVMDITDIVYFVSICALFIFLTVRSVEKRRWA